MSWLRRYRCRRYVIGSMWIAPSVSMVVAIVGVWIAHACDQAYQLTVPVDPDSARSVLSSMAAAMFTFVVFVCSALLVSLQLASSQLTPRIIGLVFNDPRTRVSLGVFTFTFTFSLAALVRINGTVPCVTAIIAEYSCFASLGFFLYLIEHVGHALRPSGALKTIARHGRAVIQSLYPALLGEEQSAVPAARFSPTDASQVIRARQFGVILAFDRSGLVALAQRHNCIIEIVPEVGSFVAAGDPLYRVYPAAAAPPVETLFQSIAIGQERTVEQDPAFALRIMVDIASKALSPAINDPTTAVLAIDQIQHLLRDLGTRRLEDGCLRDQAGNIRLFFPMPNWEDFVRLAVTEIRQFGQGSIQIVRRLRAMMEDLIAALPPERATLLQQELRLLARSAQRFQDPEDQALAESADPQGVGGKTVEPVG